MIEEIQQTRTRRPWFRENPKREQSKISKRSISTGRGYSLIASIPKKTAGVAKFRQPPKVGKRKLWRSAKKRLKSRGLSDPIPFSVTQARVNLLVLTDEQAAAQWTKNIETRKQLTKAKRARKAAMACVNALVTVRPAKKLRARTLRRLAARGK